MNFSDINIFAPINITGYGNHSINTLMALDELGIKVNLYPIGNIQREILNEKQLEVIDRFVSNSNFNCAKYSPSLCIWHQHDMARFSGEIKIAYPFFELDKLTQNEVNSLMSCDAIFVPSQWAKTIIRCSDIIKSSVYVVPSGVDNIRFQYKERMLSTRKTRFLSVGKFEQRKGHKHILAALPLVKETCDVIAHWTNPFINPNNIINEILAYGYTFNGIKYLDSNELTPKLSTHYFIAPNGNGLYLFLNYNADQGYMETLINYSDIGLFPYFAEGWCLPLADCMAAGLPCLATDYSAPTEYLTPTNHIPLVNKGMIIANDGVFFGGQGKWASFEPEYLAAQMENMINHPTLYVDINKALKGFGAQWNWKQSAKTLVKTIEDITL